MLWCLSLLAFALLIRHAGVTPFSLRLGHFAALTFPEGYSLPQSRFATRWGRLGASGLFGFCLGVVKIVNNVHNYIVDY